MEARWGCTGGGFRHGAQGGFIKKVILELRSEGSVKNPELAKLKPPNQ